MEYLYLTEKEFAVLLAAVGRKEWCGLLDESIFKSWDMEKDINQILVSLYQKEVIDWDNGKATILPFARKIFDLLKQVQQYIFYARLDEDYPIEYLYILDSDVVRARRSIHEKGKLRIALQPLEQVEQELWENGMLPVDEDLPENMFPTECPDIKADIEELIKNNIILFFEKKRFSDENPDCRFLVKEEGLYHFFYIQKKGEVQAYFEKEDAIQKIFDKWIREDV